MNASGKGDGTVIEGWVEWTDGYQATIVGHGYAQPERWLVKVTRLTRV